MPRSVKRPSIAKACYDATSIRPPLVQKVPSLVAAATCIIHNVPGVGRCLTIFRRTAADDALSRRRYDQEGRQRTESH